jgi:glyoxylase-like metal-dependent hydrolase (beta-lactamase superfamily II)
MEVGDIVIEPVHDGTAFFNPTEAYRMGMDPATAATAVGKGLSEADWAPHRALLDEHGRIEVALGGFLVRSGDRVVLVDTGVGTVGGLLSGGLLLKSLGRLGVEPADVTDVVLTHLHFDHVGWTTRHGEIVFPDATYRCDRRDWDHFVTKDPAGGAARKLGPLAGQLKTWETDGSILPGIDVLAAPGHTPGSTIIVVSSGTARAMLLGDVVHCPVELIDDEWAGLGDVDPELAKRTRTKLAMEIEGKDLPVAAAHFPGLQFGRLLAGTGTRRWVV